jgi:lysophospholipase L1-like esterase
MHLLKIVHLTVLASLLTSFLVSKPIQAADPARFAKQIDAWTEQDSKNPPKKGLSLFVGSSSIRMWSTLSADFPELTTLNRGFGGSWTQDVLHYYDRIVKPYEPSKIIFYCGENDIAGGEAPQVPFNNFKIFVDHVRKAKPCTEIYYIPMKPSPKRWSLWPKYEEGNQLIRKFCEMNGIHYLHTIPQKMLKKDGTPNPDIFIQDRLHMNAKGYRIWAEEIHKALKK